MGDGQMKLRLRHGLCALIASAASTAMAQDVRITEDMAEAHFALGGQTFVIARNQNNSNRLTGLYSITSRPCPEHCIQPIEAAAGVPTLGELETIDFLQSQVAAGTGILIDVRPAADFASASIPGAVNVPLDALSELNPYRWQIFEAIGGKRVGQGFDFSHAMQLVLYCDGPWSPDSAQTVQALVAAGYPAEKLGYYRGGMQGWLSLGLTTADTLSGG